MEKPNQEASLFSSEKLKVNKMLERKLKHALRYLENGKADLQNAMNWNVVHHQGELLQANLYQIKKGSHQIVVFDWERDQNVTIQLDPLKSAPDVVKDLFKKARKLKTSIVHRESYLKSKENEIEKWKANIAIFQNIETIEELIRFKNSVFGTSERKTTKGKQKRTPYFEFYTSAGLKIFVGRTAKDNEFVTFSLAKGNDWWLHVRDFPGSHILLRANKGEEPDQDSLQDAIQLALYYSKARDRGEGEVCITQKKFVNRLSGAKPGTVQISKHKASFARFNKERFNQFKNNQKSPN